MIRTLLPAWFLLLGFTVLSPTIGGGIVLLLAWFKFMVIVLEFMGTRRAHFVWSWLPGGFAGIVLMLCYLAA